ncbi:MAG TPA: hypothetical protein VF915_08080 [Reyranella sp.]
MSTPSPPPGGPRASRGVKLVLMGVAGAALLYSCAPGVGAGLGALPYLWFMPNPFYRPPVAGACPPGTPNCDQATQSRSGGGSSSSYSSGRGSTSSSETTSTTSQRGGFGSTGSTGSSSGS